jgi:hypothetical protein
MKRFAKGLLLGAYSGGCESRFRQDVNTDSADVNQDSGDVNI